uniref:Prokineticin 1 n=1 Tax=Pavo cristatus TaxID=9049 RepID=A0A8C9FRQ4_PAVCR
MSRRGAWSPKGLGAGQGRPSCGVLLVFSTLLGAKRVFGCSGRIGLLLGFELQASPPCIAPLLRACWVFILQTTPNPGCADPIASPQACERDPQCGSGTCCAVSLWLRGLRMCTPLGQEGDECHPFTSMIPFLLFLRREQKRRDQRLISGVPFLGKRQHHTCPCLPNFSCSRFLDGRYRCSLDFKNFDF